MSSLYLIFQILLLSAQSMKIVLPVTWLTYAEENEDMSLEMGMTRDMRYRWLFTNWQEEQID
jgi:hypothetical protein